MKNTAYNEKMIPSILCGRYGWNFVFVDPISREFHKSEEATLEWLNDNNISESEFTSHCWNEYECTGRGSQTALISYFTNDDETIYALSKVIDVENFYEEAFDI